MITSIYIILNDVRGIFTYIPNNLIKLTETLSLISVDYNAANVYIVVRPDWIIFHCSSERVMPLSMMGLWTHGGPS